MKTEMMNTSLDQGYLQSQRLIDQARQQRADYVRQQAGRLISGLLQYRAGLSTYLDLAVNTRRLAGTGPQFVTRQTHLPA